MRDAVTTHRLFLFARHELVARVPVLDGPSVLFEGSWPGASPPESRRALDDDPGHLPSLYSLAVSQEKMGEKSKAKGTWRKYLELDSDSEWADEARTRLGTLEKK